METIDLIGKTLAIAFLLCAGYVLGYSSKGINVTIIKKEPEVEEGEYNESLANELPPEVRQYHDQNGGMYKW